MINLLTQGIPLEPPFVINLRVNPRREWGTLIDKIRLTNDHNISRALTVRDREVRLAGVERPKLR